MRYHGTVDIAHVEGDEDGFHLIVETDEGDRFNFHIHGIAEAFCADVDQTIGAWLAERDHARATMPARVTEDDLDAYPLDDPKRIEMQRLIDRGGR